MKILHGTWIPQATNEFIQSGAFYLWVETSTPKTRKNQPENCHPFQLAKEELANVITSDLGFSPSPYSPINRQIVPKYFLLPSTAVQAKTELEIFNEWFTPAKKKGLVIASQQTKDGVIVCSNKGEWIPFGKMLTLHPLKR